MDSPRILKKKQKEKVGEAQSTPTEATSKRAPLTDLSNTSPSSLPSSHSSSPSLTDSISKYSFSWARKSHPDDKPKANDSSNTNSKFASVESSSNNDGNKQKNKEKEKGESQGNKENSSSMPSPLPKTPSVSGSAEAFGSVYTRRHTHAAEIRKRKGKEIAGPLSCLLGTEMPDLRENKDEDGNVGLSKSCLLPHKMKQQRVKTELNAYKDDLSRDFIDKQRAYFAKVDAFELEEEVQSYDESE